MSTPYTHSVSSAGPDRGTFCTIYSYVPILICGVVDIDG
jgi:hypothetical protein